MNRSLFRKRKQISGGIVPPFSPLSIRKVGNMNRSLFRKRKQVSAVAPPVVPIPPNMVANLVLWLDGNDLATLPNNPVDTWLDKSGLNHDATRVLPDPQPTIGAWGLNANSCVSFAPASTDGLNVTGFAFGADYSLLSVFHSTKPAANGSYSGVFCTDFSYLLEGYRDFVILDGIDGDDWGGGGTGFWTVETGNAYVNCATVVNGGNINVYSGGLSVYSGAFAPNLTGNFYIGMEEFAADKGLAGEIGELILYDRAITAGELAGVHAYLLNKWGI